jgi:hypothetical protein
VKYSPAGEELWAKRYEGPAGEDDFGEAIAIDESGNIYVTTEDDYATLKYSPQGEELWLAIYDGPEDLDDGAADIAVDSQGNVYVTGQAGSTLFNGGGDFATIRYAPK